MSAIWVICPECAGSGCVLGSDTCETCNETGIVDAVRTARIWTDDELRLAIAWHEYPHE